VDNSARLTAWLPNVLRHATEAAPVMTISRFELPADGLRAAQVCLEQRVPGSDPAGIRTVACRSGDRAAELRRAASALLSGVETGLWRGAAHRAFVEQIRAHAPSMSATADRYEHYAAALHGYAGALDETAPRLCATRGLLQQRYEELATRQPATLGSGAANHRPSADPGADLLPIARDFKAGYDRWADALDRCIRALSHADHADPTRDLHGFQAFEHRMAASAQRHLSAFERAVRQPSLRNLSECFGASNVDLTVLGLALLFVCPPAGTACLVAATVVAAARVAVDSTRRARGEQVSAGSLGLELAAAIPVGGSAFRGLRAAEDVVHLVPGGGLMAHEGIDGGHTLAKHVGKSPEFLRNRIATEPHIDAASTFYDREVAEKALSMVLYDNRRKIANWLSASKKELVLTGQGAETVGVVIFRESSTVHQANGIRLLLRRSTRLAIGYRIHTAMVTM
jgi:uncharacterized protein YukE